MKRTLWIDADCTLSEAYDRARRDAEDTSAIEGWFPSDANAHTTLSRWNRHRDGDTPTLYSVDRVYVAAADSAYGWHVLSVPREP